MNRFYIFSLLVLYSLFIQSQNSGHVEYTYIKNLGVDYSTTSILVFNKSASNFIELKSNYNIEKNYTENDEGEVSLAITRQTEIRPLNFIDIATDSLLSIEIFYKKPYLVKEVIPKIDWELTSEVKMIDKFKCQKAVGNFRGRDYTVWFTNDIPVSFGPWKLNGLPGLILEAKDSLNELYFYANKIVLGKVEEINRPFEKKTMNLKEYVKFKDGFYKEKESVIATKLPRDAKFKFTPPPRKSQKEIIYEWERQ